MCLGFLSSWTLNEMFSSWCCTVDHNLMMLFWFLNSINSDKMDIKDTTLSDNPQPQEKPFLELPHLSSFLTFLRRCGLYLDKPSFQLINLWESEKITIKFSTKLSIMHTHILMLCDLYILNNSQVSVKYFNKQTFLWKWSATRRKSSRVPKNIIYLII